MVWMRAAALPNFRKLYRIINTPLQQGTYYVDIQQNYPVKSFGGKKSVILSTSSWIGGKNLFMGIAYIVVGSICALFASVFLITWLITAIKKRSRKRL